jgi:hypothetical protein
MYVDAFRGYIPGWLDQDFVVARHGTAVGKIMVHIRGETS